MDLHLTNAAEVAVSTKTVIDRLAKVQTSIPNSEDAGIIINPRSLTIPLYTETGLYPVMHRRAEAALKYLSYLATKRPTLPWVALLEAQAFTTRG